MTGIGAVVMASGEVARPVTAWLEGGESENPSSGRSSPRTGPASSCAGYTRCSSSSPLLTSTMQKRLPSVSANTTKSGSDG